MSALPKNADKIRINYDQDSLEAKSFYCFVINAYLDGKFFPGIWMSKIGITEMTVLECK